MPEIGQTATSLLEKTWLRVRSWGQPAFDAEALGHHWQWSSRPYCVPRSSCRFEYVVRPNGLPQRRFIAACLLQAEHRAPFLHSGKLILVDRAGAAIWWWDLASVENGNASGDSVGRGIPESACRKLPDGWHQLSLETGFEALLVQRGMVVGSAWQRTPFDGRAWRSFVDGTGEGRIGPHVPPQPALVDFPQHPAFRTGGRIVTGLTHRGVQLLMAGTVLSCIACGWMFGEAWQLRKIARSQVTEAIRLEEVLKNYDLYDQVRKEISDLSQAQEAAGQGALGIALASALELTAGQNLKVRSFSIRGTEFELVLVMPSDPAKLRVLAAKLEAHPAFSEVKSRDSAEPATASLVAKVSA
ncbi:hypothetical protein OKA06_00835 [Novosphingobium sp. MW5]|nr:hypothetical protein [Novosphingobium sp. MW5]